MSSEDKFVACDFVFAGQRLLSDGTLGDGLVRLDENGMLAESGIYKARKALRVIGGIYRGAQFSATKVRGHESASYTGDRFADHEKVSEWQALHEQAKIAYAAKRLEANEKSVSQIERDMRPLREVYQALAQRDYAAASAYESAVLRALHRPLKAKEKS